MPLTILNLAATPAIFTTLATVVGVTVPIFGVNLVEVFKVLYEQPYPPAPATVASLNLSVAC